DWRRWHAPRAARRLAGLPSRRLLPTWLFSSGRNDRRIGRRITILVALRFCRQAAERAWRQIVAFTGEAVVRGVDSPLDAFRPRGARLLVAHRLRLLRGGPPGPAAGWPVRNQCWPPFRPASAARSRSWAKLPG